MFSYQNILRCHKSEAMESREHEVKPLMLQANIFPLLNLFGIKKIQVFFCSSNLEMTIIDTEGEYLL